MIDLVEEKIIEQHNDLTDYEHVDPIQLSVYGHRLMGIAEQVRLREHLSNFFPC